MEALAGKKEAGEKFTRLNARNGLSRDCQSSTVRYGYATILLPKFGGGALQGFDRRRTRARRGIFEIWDLFAFRESFYGPLGEFLGGSAAKPGVDQQCSSGIDRGIYFASERVRFLHAGACGRGCGVTRQRGARMDGANRS